MNNVNTTNKYPVTIRMNNEHYADLTVADANINVKKLCDAMVKASGMHSDGDFNLILPDGKLHVLCNAKDTPYRRMMSEKCGPIEVHGPFTQILFFDSLAEMAGFFVDCLNGEKSYR